MSIYDDFLMSKSLEGVSTSTLQAYRYSVGRLLAVYPDPLAVSPADVRRWLGGLDVGVVSIATYIKNVRVFFNWCRAEGLRDDSPMDRIPTPKLPDTAPKALTDVEVKALMEAARRSSARDLAVVLCLLDSAVRSSELGALNRWSDVDLDSGVLRVRRGKGGKERLAYVGPITVRALRRYLTTRRDNDPALFLSQRHQPLNKDSLRQLLYRLCDKAGIPRHGPHAVRHTAATTLAKQGIDSWSLMQILGHSDNKISLHYIWLTGRDIQQAHARYSPVAALVGRRV